MEPDGMDDLWIDGAGSDGELNRVLEGFCDVPPAAAGVGVADMYGDVCGLEQLNSRKRAREESSAGPKSKACREKMRRDRLSDRFLELSSILDPGRPPKSDKATVLCEASRVLQQLRSEVQQLKESNEKLHEAIKDLKVEKNELRDEKMKSKAEKERLEHQIKAMSLPPVGYIPHPIAFHPPAAAPLLVPQNSQASANKVVPIPAFPGMAMWPWLPPAILDTTQDPKLWPPNA